MNVASSFVCTHKHLSVTTTDLSQIHVTGVSDFSLSYIINLLYCLAATLHRNTNIKAQSLDKNSREFRDLLKFRDIVTFGFLLHIVSFEGDNELIEGTYEWFYNYVET